MRPKPKQPQKQSTQSARSAPTARPALAKRRLVQQMAMTRLKRRQLKEYVAQQLHKCDIIITTCNQAIEDMGPVIDRWIQSGFKSKSRKLYHLAARYIQFVRARNDAMMAQSLLIKTGDELLNGPEE